MELEQRVSASLAMLSAKIGDSGNGLYGADVVKGQINRQHSKEVVETYSVANRPPARLKEKMDGPYTVARYFLNSSKDVLNGELVYLTAKYCV